MPVAVPLAIVGSAVAGAAISGSAAKDAAKTQAAAANQASQQQLDMFNTIRGDLSPYRGIGADAVSPYEKLLGIGGGTSGTSGGAAASGPTPDWNAYLASNPDVAQSYAQLSSTPEGQASLAGLGITDATSFAAHHYNTAGKAEGRTLTNTAPAASAPSAIGPDGQPISDIEAQLQALPGYQFQRDQGIASIGRALGSRGQTGAQAKGIARFVTGLADTTYGEQVNRIRDAVSTGQNAANQTGAFGQTAASNSGQALIGGANASAAGQVGAANAAGSALSSIPNALLSNKLLGGGGLYGGGGNGAAYGTVLSNSGNYYGGSYGGGSVPY